MSLVRIGENLLTIFILGGFGYIVIQSYKGNNVFANFKDKIVNMKKGGNKK